MTGWGEDRDPSIDQIRSLLREWTETLRKMRTELTSSRSRSPHEIRDYLENTIHGMEEFARHVSQRLEHGRIDELSAIELRIRLAQFEGELRRTTDAATYR